MGPVEAPEREATAEEERLAAEAAEQQAAEGEGFEPEGDVQDDTPEPLQGTRQLSLDVGGEKPDTSKITVIGGALELEGQFHKGEEFEAVVRFRVGAVEFTDSHTPGGEVKGTVRKHKARIVGCYRPEDE